MSTTSGLSSGDSKINYSESPAQEGINNDDVKFLDSTFTSFDQIDKDDTHNVWIKGPDSKKDFFTLIRDTETMESPRYQDWLWQANAETETDLLKHGNNITGDRADRLVKGFTNNNTMGTWVKQGAVLFCVNRNNQLLFGQGAHSFKSSITSPDPEGKFGALVDLNLPENRYVKKRNVIIITLQPDEIAIGLQDRKPVILLPGRHCYNDSNFSLSSKDISKVGTVAIRKHSVTVIMILPGFLGFGYEKGQPILLKPGLHISREPSFEYQSTLDMRSLTTDPISASQFPRIHISHDNIHLVRILQNQFGKAHLDGEPVFLKPGLHLYNNPSFAFKGICNQYEEMINHENLFIIQVQPNKIGLAWEGDTPILIQPGVWYKNNPLFRFVRFANTSDDCIEHGPITRYQVKHGQIGFAWVSGHVVQLAAGIGTVVDPNFKFHSTFPANQQVIHFGNIAHITTPEGSVRPIYLNGGLEILTSGYRSFKDPNIKIKPCFPIGEIISDMKEIEVLTRDRTPMLITGQVTYQITSPKNLILNLGYEELLAALEKTVDAILRHAFSITDLSTISPDANTLKKNIGMDLFREESESVERKTFQGILCHEVHKELDKNTASWGITIRDVAISSIFFKDREVAKKLAAATSNTRTAEAKFDLTQAKNKIQLETAQAEADLKLIGVENQAKIKRINVEVKSELQLIEQKSNVQAKAMKQDQEIKTSSYEVEAKAEANALHIRTLAEAERDAAILEAEGLKALADAQIAKVSNPALLQLEMMKLYVEGMGHLAMVPQPSVVLRSSDEGKTEDGNGSQMLNVFRHQGRSLLSAAMKKKEFQGVDNL